MTNALCTFFITNRDKDFKRILINFSEKNPGQKRKSFHILRFIFYGKYFVYVRRGFFLDSIL